MMLDEVASSMSSLNSWKSMVNPPCSCPQQAEFQEPLREGDHPHPSPMDRRLND